MVTFIQLTFGMMFHAVLFLFIYVVIPIGAIMMLLTPIIPLCAWLDYKNDPRIR